jgi:hypothetical protein
VFGTLSNAELVVLRRGQEAEDCEIETLLVLSYAPYSNGLGSKTPGEKLVCAAHRDGLISVVFIE